VSTAAALLQQASSVLNSPSGHSNRMACWIARTALEAAVDNLLGARQRSAPSATMRSKLTVLQVACGPDDEIAARAHYAWTGLSVACHHHAFELAPTATEVRHFISLVGTVVDAAPPLQYGR
jgi:hypothetical protein